MNLVLFIVGLTFLAVVCLSTAVVDIILFARSNSALKQLFICFKPKTVKQIIR